MKTEIEIKETTYPCLKRIDLMGDTIVVLFISPKTGTVVLSNVNDKPIGFYDTSWKEANFHHFSEKIILSND